jgi:hypothetical protein
MTNKDFLGSLSPVKKRIALYLFKGLSPEQTAKKISKENKSDLKTIGSYVTMVLDDANEKGVVFTKKEKATYVNSEKKDAGKIAVRGRVAEEVLSSKITKGIVLTLCWVKCILEKELNEKLKALKFLPCEMNLNTFIELANFISVNGLNFMLEPLKCEIGRIIRTSNKDAFAHLFLDYCGTLNTFKEEIYIAIENKIVVKGGIVWITVSRPYETGTIEQLERLVKQAGGNSYKVIWKHNYRDGMPMSTIIIKRVK